MRRILAKLKVGKAIKTPQKQYVVDKLDKSHWLRDRWSQDPDEKG